jgi:carboxymethylenebutenolidase
MCAPSSAGVLSRAEDLAAEGYVVQPLCALDERSVEQALQGLRNHAALRGQVAAVATGEATSAALRLAARGALAALVLYEGCIEPEAVAQLDCPVLWNLAAGPASAASQPVHALRALAAAHGERLQVFSYAGTQSGFSDPDSSAWNAFQAGMAYSRALGLLRQRIGPHYNLSELWDRHLECEFVLKDATANMKTMVAQPYVNHVPTMTGGVGHDLLKRFYAHHFIHQAPADRRSITLSRTVGPDRVIEEKIFCFTHDIEMDWMLPGVKPTGRYVEIPLVVVVTFRGDKLYNEHIYWDQASVLAQLGLIDPAGLPIAGVQQARKLLDPRLPSNTLMARWHSSENEPV